MNTWCCIFFIEVLTDIVTSYQLHEYDPVKNDTKHGDLLIIDTDAGIDDAFAIMLLIEGEKRHTSGKIIAITTVTGNTDVNNVTENVFAVLNLENRLDIPVYKGAMIGLAGERHSDGFFGKNGFGDVPIERPKAKVMDGHAANALVDLVNKYPGQVTLLTLGPLTNIAIALSLDNLFLTKLKKWVDMGGSNHGLGFFYPSRPGVESNFYLDPVSAYFAYNSSINLNSTTLLTWDAVELMKISEDWRWNKLALLQSKRMKFLNYIESNIERGEYWISADSVAALMLIDSSVIKQTSYHAIEVVKEGVFDGGLIVDYHDILEDQDKKFIVESLDNEVFEKYLLEYLNAL